MRRRRPIPPTHHLKTAIRKIDKIVWKLHDEQLAAYIAYVLGVNKGEKREIRKLFVAKFTAFGDLCLANCYFAHDSSGFPILLLFFDAQSGRSCYPLDRNAGPVARTWWRPFPGRGVASPKTPASDRE
jgi:hypothetical protein